MAIDKQAEICEIITGFMKAKVRFNGEFESWESAGSFDSAVMDRLEEDLYHLKSRTHLALRDGKEQNSGFIQKADLFDLIIGSIFHEALHLKEYIYTLRSYAPRYNSFAGRKKNRKLDIYTDDFLKHSMAIVNEAKTNLPKKAYEVKNLFEDALLLIEDIIKKYRSNSRVIRTLFTSSEILDRVYGENGLEALYSKIYREGPAQGYLKVGASFMKDGFHKEAFNALEKAARAAKRDGLADALGENILKKCQQLQKVYPQLKKRAEDLISGMQS